MIGDAALRILFASPHSYLDPSSGAAATTRDVLEALAARGHDCRVLSAGLLDYSAETRLDEVLDAQKIRARHALAARDAGGPVEVRDLMLDGVRVTLMPTSSSRPDQGPDRGESAAWLDLAAQALGRFRPHVLLTYGGHPVVAMLMKRARLRGVRVAFHLHNFAYADRGAFADADAVLVPSEYSRRHHSHRLGLDSTAVAPPVRPERVVARDHRPQFLTFVNPALTKGVTVFARIAHELGRRRPDIPMLVVEGRSGAGAIANLGIDMSEVGTLNWAPNTPDPRRFYRFSRAVLMPSLWLESFGRVAAEALFNGLPVLASDRGALPETLGEAGIVLPVPDRCTPVSREPPTAREVEPWIAAIERIWDDPEFEAAHRARARARAEVLDPGAVVEAYETFFRRLASQ